MTKPAAHRFNRKPYAWTVEVKGIGTVPVFHDTCYTAPNYYHESKADVARFNARMDALEATSRMILQRDTSPTDITCAGYVGGNSTTAVRATVFTVDNVQIDRDALTVAFRVTGLA